MPNVACSSANIQNFINSFIESRYSNPIDRLTQVEGTSRTQIFLSVIISENIMSDIIRDKYYER